PSLALAKMRFLLNVIWRPLFCWICFWIRLAIVGVTNIVVGPWKSCGEKRRDTAVLVAYASESFFRCDGESVTFTLTRDIFSKCNFGFLGDYIKYEIIFY